MRVHGEILIKRRTNISPKSNYGDYSPELKEDFKHICGYCGKSELVTTKGFEIDHFVPDKIDPSRKTDYNNLVYACFTCNRKKGEKWPSNDKNINHTDSVGFIDPTTEEYDQHVERTEDGDIVAITQVGEYMCKTGFKFNLRPMREIWKYMSIMNRQRYIEQHLDEMSNFERNEYIAINVLLKELHSQLFDKKE